MTEHAETIAFRPRQRRTQARVKRRRRQLAERTLRRLLESLVWEDQRALWAELRAVAG